MDAEISARRSVGTGTDMGGDSGGQVIITRVISYPLPFIPELYQRLFLVQLLNCPMQPPTSAVPDFYYAIFAFYEPALTTLGFVGTLCDPKTVITVPFFPYRRCRSSPSES